MENSLILATTPLWTAHHSESIEIAHRLKGAGKNFYVACTGSLKSCPANPDNIQYLCKRCRYQTNHTKKLLLPKNCEYLELKFSPKYQNWKPKIKNTRELLDISYDGMPIGRLVASQIFDDEKGEYIDVDNFQKKIRTLINDGINLYDATIDLIKMHKIDNVYAWNGRRQCDGPALWAAKKCEINYFSYISGGEKNKVIILKSLSVQDFEARNLDKINFLKKIPKKERMKIRFAAEKYFKQYKSGTLNQTGYTYHKLVNSEPYVKKGSKPILLLAMSSPREHVHQQSYDYFFSDDPYGATLKILDENNYYVPCEKEQEIIRKMLFMRKEKNSYQKIADEITASTRKLFPVSWVYKIIQRDKANY